MEGRIGEFTYVSHGSTAILMVRIKHRFINHRIHPKTQTLVIGTFNPDTEENCADFFYGRPRNFLWTLIPTSFNEASLKGKRYSEKLDFIDRHKIDFIDLISQVEVEEVANYEDIYLDNKVYQWTNIISEIDKLSSLKSVCFTRKSFRAIPNIKAKIEAIQSYCEAKNITFQFLTTPARFYRLSKQTEWSTFFHQNY